MWPPVSHEEEPGTKEPCTMPGVRGSETMKLSALEEKFLALWKRRCFLPDAPAWVRDLPEPIFNKTFHPVRKWRFDFQWPAYRVAVEVDGGIFSKGKKRLNHASGPGIQADHEKRNAALELGWRVLVFTSQDLFQRPLETIQQVAKLLHRGKVVDIPEQGDLFT